MEVAEFIQRAMNGLESIGPAQKVELSQMKRLGTHQQPLTRPGIMTEALCFLFQGIQVMTAFTCSASLGTIFCTLCLENLFALLKKIQKSSLRIILICGENAKKILLPRDMHSIILKLHDGERISIGDQIPRTRSRPWSIAWTRSSCVNTDRSTTAEQQTTNEEVSGCFDMVIYCQLRYDSFSYTSTGRLG